MLNTSPLKIRLAMTQITNCIKVSKILQVCIRVSNRAVDGTKKSFLLDRRTVLKCGTSSRETSYGNDFRQLTCISSGARPERGAMHQAFVA
jgi:hypothetical protein